MLGGLDDDDGADRRAAASSASTERRLVAVWEGGRIELPLPAHGTLSIGRAASCDLRIDDPSVSEVHMLVHVGEELLVEDAGSSSGSSVRHVTISPGDRIPVAPGDLVEIGAAVVFARFGGDRAPAPRPSRPSSIRLKAADVARTRGPHHPPPLCTADPAMRRLGEMIDVVAPGDLSVLLIGETGAGKEVVAHEIHARSVRAEGPFIAINCAAVPESLFESELFGYERGAFTGAITAKMGLLEAANGGTLFLDEIGEMPLATQAKLLRAIERREITRVGSTRSTRIDVRIVAATQRNLDRAIAAGRFREDLFYRLNGFTLFVPALRERPGAIGALAISLLDDACERQKKKRPALGRDALRVLEGHSWPGNVRELRNVMERAALLSTGGVVLPEHLILDVRSEPGGAEADLPPPSTDSLGMEIEQLERRRILGALEECAGNQTLAAKRLGISRRRLLKRLDEYGVPRPRKHR